MLSALEISFQRIAMETLLLEEMFLLHLCICHSFLFEEMAFTFIIASLLRLLFILV